MTLVSGFVVCADAALIAATAPSVSVDVIPARIVRRTFDPARPPADMPKLTPPEVGQCVYEFGCEMETRVERPTRATGRVRVTATSITTRLNITLWTPRNGPPGIVEHEEGHREICEIYYRPAASIARRVGERMVGQTLMVQRGDTAATTTALREFQDTFIREILRETLTRCSYAQKRFDAITQHSLARVPVSDAIAQAVADEIAFAKSNARPSRVDPVIPPPTSRGAPAERKRVPPTRPRASR